MLLLNSQKKTNYVKPYLNLRDVQNMPNCLKYINPQTKRYTPIKHDSEISTYRIKHKQRCARSHKKIDIATILREQTILTQDISDLF